MILCRPMPPIVLPSIYFPLRMLDCKSSARDIWDGIRESGLASIIPPVRSFESTTEWGLEIRLHRATPEHESLIESPPQPDLLQRRVNTSDLHSPAPVTAEILAHDRTLGICISRLTGPSVNSSNTVSRDSRS